MVGAVLPVHDAEHALFLDVLALAADGLGGLEADERFAVPEICGFSVLVPIFRVVMLAAELLGETVVVRAVHTGAGFLQEAVQAIREAGGVYIADEVQSGFARTGLDMWGFMRHSVVPDIVTMGKPMGNGHPIAGMLARAEVLKPFGEEARYFNTFGGNPVSIAAAAATLRVIQEQGLQANADRMGQMIRDGFEALARKHPAIGDVRGDGMFIGVELVEDRHTKAPAKALTHQVVNGMRRRGVLISSTGTRGNVLKIRPLLPFTETHAAQLLEAAADTLADL